VIIPKDPKNSTKNSDVISTFSKVAGKEKSLHKNQYLFHMPTMNRLRKKTVKNINRKFIHARNST
jgi:hypothetical protein